MDYVNLSDEELELALRRDASLPASQEQAAGRAIQAALALPGGPRFTIERDLNAFRHRMCAVPQSDGRPNSPADFASRVARLRIASEAAAHFGRYARMSQDERMATVAADQAAASRALLDRQQPPPPPAFSVAQFLVSLAARGIMVSVGPKETIAVHPAQKLTEHDRGVLRAHRDAILDAVRSGTETF